MRGDHDLRVDALGEQGGGAKQLGPDHRRRRDFVSENRYNRMFP